tara:strand:- start:738 stop:887 length:150 start_codon:yes stop_codon:yes gene_type:complete
LAWPNKNEEENKAIIPNIIHLMTHLFVVFISVKLDWAVAGSYDGNQLRV